MIEQLLALGATRDEIADILVEQLGMTLTAAEEAIAIALGESDGDVLIVDEEGKPVTVEPIYLEDISNED